MNAAARPRPWLAKQATELAKIDAAIAEIAGVGCGSPFKEWDELVADPGRMLNARTQAAPAPPVIEVVKVVERPIDGTVAMPGELEPYETVAIHPRATGFVKSIARL